MNTKKDERRVRMVLYKMHDYDLVAYACSLKDKSLGNPKISFYSVVKGLLNQYVKGDTFTAPHIKKFTEKSLPSKVVIRFTLDKEKDKELIELFNNIRERQKNSFLKSLVRRNLNLDGLSCYYVDGYDYSKFKTNKLTEPPKPIKKKPELKVQKEEVVEEVKEPVKKLAETLEFKPESTGFDFFGAIGNINN